MTEPPAPLSFELPRLIAYTEAAMLAELHRVAALVPGRVLTRDAFDAYGKVASSTLIRKLGGWRGALDAAGLGHRYGGRTVSLKMKEQAARSLSDAELVAELQAVARALDRDVITRDDLNEHSRLISADAVRRRFGSWQAGVEAAGLRIANLGRRHTYEDYFENLLEVWTYYGRAPVHREMDQPPSRITSGAYEKKYGTWSRARQAFVQRVHSDVGAPVASEASPVSPREPGPMPSVGRPPSEDQRTIRLGLRYQVLSRDRFRCVACGSSPATDLSCVLHVDHVVPFSHGGKTVLDNLRALCADCNLGKGTRTHP